MNAGELALQIQATEAFILADAEEITLERPGRVSDGAGGFRYTSALELAPQIARLIPQSDKVPEMTGSDGRAANSDWIILFAPGSDVERYDQFVWRDIRWEIAQIHHKPDYEMKGDVILHNGI